MLRTVVELGRMSIQVEAPTIEALLEEVQYIRDLDAAREGEPTAEPFHRSVGGFRYWGFRRGDGAEIYWGRYREPLPGRLLFSYSPTSEGYRGWTRYDQAAGERLPAAGQPGAANADGDGADTQAARLQYIRTAGPQLPDGARAQLGARGRGRSKHVDLREYVRDHWPQIKESEELAGEVVAAIGKATGIPLAADPDRREQ